MDGDVADIDTAEPSQEASATPIEEVGASREVTATPIEEFSSTVGLATVEERRETARGRVAAALLLILAAISVAPFVALWLAWATVAELTALLQIIFGPVVALVGAVTGFYFGAATTS